MDRLSIDVESCYGIKKLEKQLDFTGETVYAIQGTVQQRQQEHRSFRPRSAYDAGKYPLKLVHV
jgi:hypothetical protein